MNPNDYPPDWEQISLRIRFERAGGKCERCQAPHGQIVARTNDERYVLFDGRIYCANTGAFLGQDERYTYTAVSHPLIILTTAHLDHNTRNNEESNLMALCQRCHFRHDAQDNARRRKYGKAFIAKAPQLF